MTPLSAGTKPLPIIAPEKLNSGRYWVRLADKNEYAAELMPESFGAKYSPCGKHLAFIVHLSLQDPEQGPLQCWAVVVTEASSGEPQALFGHSCLRAASFAWSADGRTITTAGEAGDGAFVGLVRFDAQSGCKLEEAFDFQSAQMGMLSPHGRFAVVMLNNYIPIMPCAILDVAARRKAIQLPFFAVASTWHPDDGTFVAMQLVPDCRVVIYDAVSGAAHRACPFTFDGDPPEVRSFAWVPELSRIICRLTKSSPQTGASWALVPTDTSASTAPIKTVGCRWDGMRQVLSMTCSPDTAHMAVATARPPSDDIQAALQAHVFGLETGQLLHSTPEAVPEDLTTWDACLTSIKSRREPFAAFSPDGKWAVFWWPVLGSQPGLQDLSIVKVRSGPGWEQVAKLGIPRTIHHVLWNPDCTSIVIESRQSGKIKDDLYIASFGQSG